MALNVLIVDDSPLMRKMVGRVLNLSGLEIGNLMDAGNGAEALQAMSEHTVDLVFVDINMPIMNGEDDGPENGVHKGSAKCSSHRYFDRRNTS